MSEHCIEGGCRCNRVRIRIAVPPLLTMACHCSGCQRMTGSAFSLSSAVPGDGFSVIQGTPAIGALHGPTQHYFCPHCMSWVFTRPQNIGFVSVRSTLLDEPPRQPPFMETMTCEKLPWVNTLATHSFEHWPPPDSFERLVHEFAERYPAWNPQ